jgi:hypothetical protein
MPQKMSITHDSSKRLRARPIMTEAVSFAIITAPAARVSCTLLGLCVVVPWAVLSVCLRFRLST